MRLYSLVMTEPDEYALEIECEPEVTESFVIKVTPRSCGGNEISAVVGDARFIARVPDAMTRRDIYKLVAQFHSMRVKTADALSARDALRQIAELLLTLDAQAFSLVDDIADVVEAAGFKTETP